MTSSLFKQSTSIASIKSFEAFAAPETDLLGGGGGSVSVGGGGGGGGGAPQGLAWVESRNSLIRSA